MTNLARPLVYKGVSIQHVYGSPSSMMMMARLQGCRHEFTHSSAPQWTSGQAFPSRAGDTGMDRRVSLVESYQSLFVGCLTSQQHASVYQGRICSDNSTRCHTEIEVADPTFCLTQSQYTNTGPTNPIADPIMPGAWECSHWSVNF